MRIYNLIQGKSWQDMKPGWYELEINFDEDKEDEFCSEFLLWLYERVDLCERHALWMVSTGKIRLKFRHERSFILCNLRWG